MAKKRPIDDLEPVMGADPLADAEEILQSTFYGATGRADAREAESRPTRRRSTRQRRSKKARKAPTHYKIVSISLYTEDIERIDGLVAELKETGHPKANRSALIRYAIDTVDISKMPKSY